MEGLFIKCEFCGKEFVKKAKNQKYCKAICRERAKRKREKEFNEKRIDRKKGRKEPERATLCWRCQNAICGCSWSRDFIPVEGWKAKPTKIRCEKGNRDMDSFLVIECPEFVADER